MFVLLDFKHVTELLLLLKCIIIVNNADDDDLTDIGK